MTRQFKWKKVFLGVDNVTGLVFRLWQRRRLAIIFLNLSTIFQLFYFAYSESVRKAITFGSYWVTIDLILEHLFNTFTNITHGSHRNGIFVDCFEIKRQIYICEAHYAEHTKANGVKCRTDNQSRWPSLVRAIAK